MLSFILFNLDNKFAEPKGNILKTQTPKPIPKKNLNYNLENEIIIGLHLIRKSANALVENLRYFNQIPKYFSADQIAKILVQIEEVEQNIKNVREIFNKRVL